MNTTTTNTQRANAGQNSEQSAAAFVLEKIQRELNGAATALSHVANNLIPELRAALPPLVLDPAPCTSEQVCAEFNRRGILCRIESGGFGTDVLIVQVSYAAAGVNRLPPFVECKWFWRFAADWTSDNWTGSLYKSERSPQTGAWQEYPEPLAFMETDISLKCAAPIEVVDGFLCGRVIRAGQ